MEEDADNGTSGLPGSLVDAGVRGLRQRSQWGLIHWQRGAGLGSTTKITGAWVGNNARVSATPAATTHKELAGSDTSPATPPSLLKVRCFNLVDLQWMAIYF